MRTALTGPALAVHTCARRLAAVGTSVVDGAEGPGAGNTTEPARLVIEWPAAPGPPAADGASARDGVCDLSWFGPAGLDERDGSESVVQAASGLMHLHGRDGGHPRRIGVEIASVAAGMLAAQSLLALAVGRTLGHTGSTVRTSVLQSGLLQASHYVAAATCEEQWVPAPAAAAPGPPFRTADGCGFEIETFDAEAWKGFWLRLGAPAADLGRAWTLFRPRYYRGTTSLPGGFHEATMAHSLDDVTAAARAFGVSLCPVRSYDEVLVDPGRTEGNPHVEPLVPTADTRRAAGLDAPLGGRRGGDPTEAGIGATGGAGAGPLPLAGIEVVEATSRLQGPLAGLLLQMLGARVRRVEPPGGDIGRGVPPLADDTGSFFLAFNRGKSTVELDLGAAHGRADLANLAAGSDVFLHNWRPGKAKEWGLGPDDLGARHPGLVYAAASGWDDGSSASGLIGTDFLVQAFCGLGHGIEPEPRAPAPSRVLLTDFMGALVTCEGVLSGLYRRTLHQGRGCRVRTSLQAGAMALQAHVLDALDGVGRAGAAYGARRRGRPVWGLLDVPVEASDGFLVLDVTDEVSFARLCRLCGLDASAERAEIERQVVERIGKASAIGWEKQLSDAGIPSAAVATDLAALPDDDRLSHLFETLAGPCRAPATPWRFDP